MPGVTMPVSGSTLSRILRDAAKGRIPVNRLALRSQGQLPSPEGGSLLDLSPVRCIISDTGPVAGML